MKDLPNKEVNTKDRDRMRELYDAAPYPDAIQGQMQQQGTILLEHWINAATASDRPAFHKAARILVAGCGSGLEVIALARQFPAAQVVGVDFSARSIELAKIKGAVLTNASFEVADLTTDEWCDQYEPFDFILCHGVADYVLDTQALMRTLATCLTSDGLIYMTVNTPYHPAQRIQDGFDGLGISSAEFIDSPQQRQLLQMMVRLMGHTVGIDGLGERPKAYLNIDIFPPIAHHLTLEEWCAQATAAGLHFCGSMDALLGLTLLADEQLPQLYGLGKTDLSIWMAKLQQRPGMQLLFSKRALVEPRFDQPEVLWQWRPQLAACIGTIPPMTGDMTKSLPLTLRFQGLPDFILYSTAYDLEVLRHCDGTRSLSEILEAMTAQGNIDHLVACLFRSYHYGWLA